MLLVRLTRGGTVEAEFKLDQADLRMGRSTDNEIALQDPDKTLSRHHAELRREGDRWIYLDLNSANGSWVGERRITRMELVPGLAITLGDYQLTLARVDDAAEGAGALGEKTQMFRRDADTLRPAPAPKPPTPATPLRVESPVIGGAIAAAPVAAAPPPAPGMTPIRRIIVFGSILVFGAFAVVIALLLRPDTSTPAAESAAPSTPATPPAARAPAPPAEPAPSPTPAPAPVAEVPPPAPAPTPAPADTTAKAAAAAAAARPRPLRDTDPDAATVPARAGESAAALQKRRDDVRRRYAQALQSLAVRRFGEARDLFAALSREVPRFRDIDARLAESNEGLRQEAADDFKAAAKLEETAMWSEAMAAYEKLRPSESVLPGLAEAIERTRKKMNEAGVDALTRARQFDSRGRMPEAVAWYQRAVKWLPPDHPGLEAAKQRLAQLVNRP